MKHSQGYSEPELILANGIIGGDPSSQALAIAHGLIIGIGRDDEITRLAGPDTATVNLEGRLVLPGFIDTHIHFHEWSLQRRELQLGNVGSIDELLACVQREALTKHNGQWVTGLGWNEADWQEKRMPTRRELDSVAPNHPVLLLRCDLHLAVVNTVALKKAGITSNTPDPQQGRIVRDVDGEPNGILRELAINLIRDAVAPPGLEQVAALYTEAIEALYRVGITGIHDTRLMDDSDGGMALRTFQVLDKANQLGLRSWVTLPGHRLDEIISLGLRSGFGNERLRIGHVKFFSDGGVGARTAWMTDPYLDGGKGMPLMDMRVLDEAVKKADSAGLSVMVHAIGDRANHELINIFADLHNQPPAPGSFRPAYPHRLEHLQVIRPQDVERLRHLPLALGVTPANLLLDINLIDTTLGERGQWAYALRSLIDTGRPVMFSSDCPVCDPNPLLGLQAAVNRQRSDGTPAAGWYPESRIAMSEAVAAYTSVPAGVHAVNIGRIAPDHKADIAVFSKDFISDETKEILSSKVDMTLFDGKIVFRNF